METQFNVNVNVPSSEGNNVNVNVIKNPAERNAVVYIMHKLGAESVKDFPYWRKVAQNLSVAQIAEGIEIAKCKKTDSKARIKYASGIFRNMMLTTRR